MTQQASGPKGNFIISENRNHGPGGNQPLYKDGRITLPESDVEIAVKALWGAKSDKGLVLSGELDVPSNIGGAER